jgi:hypothetical protein
MRTNAFIFKPKNRGGSHKDNFDESLRLCKVAIVTWIFIVSRNRFKTNKYPDENPDLPMDFNYSDRKPKSKTFVKCLWLPKRNQELWERKP